METGQRGRPGVARPGDVCVLLQPAGEDLGPLRDRQRSLLKIYGERLYEPMHLTCQRFALGGDGHRRSLPPVIVRLASVEPFPILAEDLVLMEHQFWRSRLLRWRVRGTAELRSFCEELEQGLICEGIRPDFPSELGCRPRYVTALKGVENGQAGLVETGRGYPCRLFEARRVVFSLIEKGRRFRILEETRMGVG